MLLGNKKKKKIEKLAVKIFVLRQYIFFEHKQTTKWHFPEKENNNKKNNSFYLLW